jgi:hypothetical protein
MILGQHSLCGIAAGGAQRRTGQPESYGPIVKRAVGLEKPTVINVSAGGVGNAELNASFVVVANFRREPEWNGTERRNLG